MKRLGSTALMLAAAMSLLLPAAPAAAHSEIEMVGTQFVPAVTTADVGHVITWMNMELADYPVVESHHGIAPDPDVAAAAGMSAFPTTSPTLDEGETWEWTATEAGTYAYRCPQHPAMRGLLIVEAAA